uniref:Putative anti-proliferation factor btg1/tob n=1 Tax=Tabanus bromius TaxID=304241 RepID=A0A0K8TPR1_TABBR
MHIEVQVALNFVISYLYNKLPRRRVNLFGEELEKALKDKFQGHWYPEKPFKGSAFRCLKTGDPVDAVLDRAARESGVPISDILENLPQELAVWVDPGEVSYRIGEKGAVKILFSENSDHPEDSSADREVTKTFNPEAQCFRPIDAVNTSMGGLSLSPKTSPQGSPPTSSSSPTFKGNLTTSPAPAGSFLPRTQAPLTFTTATFAQTKFGSTKLKTNSKRANSSYRMSPTEFSNYIKQRAMQQQLHHSHGPANGHFGPIGPSSPSRSLSPNPLALGLQNDPFYFPNISMGMYPQFGGPRNMFESHFHPESNGIYGTAANGQGKFSSYIEPHGFYGMNTQQQQQQQQQQTNGNGNNSTLAPNVANVANGNINTSTGNNANSNNNNNNVNTNNNNNNSSAVVSNGSASSQVTPISSPGSNQESNSKLIDGLNSFYSNAGPYQHLLVAN